MRHKSNGWGLVRSFCPNSLTKPRLTPIGFYCNFTMKKLPLLIIVCVLVSVTAWAGWKKPDPNAKQLKNTNAIFSRLAPPICCSADGKTLYMSYVSPDLGNVGNGYTSIILYKSTDGGETWLQQVMEPGLNPAK